MYNYMVEFKGKVKKWGNSFGIVIPKEVIKEKKWKENDEVTLLSMDAPPLKDFFGKAKFKGSAQQIKDELRRELYDD